MRNSIVNNTLNELENIDHARSFCLFIAEAYWKSIKARTGIKWRMRKYGSSLPTLSPDLKDHAQSAIGRISKLEPEYAGYELSIYYMDLLPKNYREKHGIYYTPIDIVNVMLHDAESNGINLKTARIIDTSSGGSAFLAPTCRLMKREGLSDQKVVEDIESRLTGFELDSFAAWLSQFLIDCEIALLAPKANRRPKLIVQHADALIMSSVYFGCYDYVIGNPPYGKLNPCNVPPERYDDILSGTPNLYQLFYKLAFMLVRDNGIVHLITPTGFIGGKYFKALRTYIENNATPLSFSFFQHRKNIFSGVQQELVISLFRKNKSRRNILIRLINTNSQNGLQTSKIGNIYLNKNAPWALPRSKEELKLSKIYHTNPHKLADYGYVVQTGYVVPHRSADFLSHQKKKNAHPLIWSESIIDGELDPDIAYKKGRPSWYESGRMTGLIQESVILIKRTSSKEQMRRIHAALVDDQYIKKNGGFFAENHVNVMRATNNPEVDLKTILHLLNTRIVDQLFRCISGTVTVSSTELSQLPMPTPHALKIFEKRVLKTDNPDDIEHAARAAYGVPS